MGARTSEIAVVVLAAGKGTRMKSSLVKVLHPIAGQPMLSFPLEAAQSLNPEHLVVVVGRDAQLVRETFEGRATFALQEDQRGTGHAVLQARESLKGFTGDVLILYGDTPLLLPETLESMVELKAASEADLVLLTAEVDVPGIVIRDGSGGVERIVEETDATVQELTIRERNTGVYLVSAELLWKTLAQVDDQNQQGEIYLTDLVGLSVRDGRRVEAMCLEDPDEAIGINTRAELAAASAVIRRRIMNQLMADGVTIVDPNATYIDVGVEVGPDTVIEPGCSIQGECRIGRGVHLKPGCTIESSLIGDGVVMGPNAHLRPGSDLGRGVRIGNFVEIKNSVLGEGVKADHLSYIGDADVGARASFGCGSITVNYDWDKKHRTIVGRGATVGCNANLIAPITIGENAAVAAGSTVGGEIPKDALAVERARHRNIEGWAATRRSGSSSPQKKGGDSKSD